MIPHYRDHAANERTYLAWVRTGITVMMLGFFLEKFDLFLLALAHQRISPTTLETGHSGAVSLALVALGIFMISAATVRFFATKRAIEGEMARVFRGMGLMLLVSLAMIGFGVYLLSYLYGLL